MDLFMGKTLMITGGTGSFGNVVLNRFIRTNIEKNCIFSRNEKKQDDMRHDYQVRYPNVVNKIVKFNSNNTRRLNLEETKSTIAKLFHIQDLLTQQ